MDHTITTAVTPKKIRATVFGTDTTQPGVIVKSNGTTNFGLVAAGMVLGKITSSGKLRPVGKDVTADATSADTTLTLTSGQTFYVGDSVKVTSTLGVAGTKAITASSGVVITATGRNLDGLAHAIVLIDPSANDQTLYQDVSFNASTGVATINIYLATNGGGSITSTVTQVIAELNSNVAGTLVSVALTSGSGSATAIAVASSALTGGVATGGTISTGNAITAVDRDALTITVTSALTCVAGDIVQLTDGSQTAIGILELGVTTLDSAQTTATGTPTYADRSCTWGFRGDYYTAQLVGYTTATKSDLAAYDASSTIVKL